MMSHGVPCGVHILGTENDDFSTQANTRMYNVDVYTVYVYIDFLII